MYIVPVVVGPSGGGIKALRFGLKKKIENNELLDETIAIMQRTVLMDSESIISLYLRVAFDSFAVRFTFIFSECLFACL